MNEQTKTTAHTVRVAQRAGIGATLDLTDGDHAQIDARKAEQAARLARIAARRAEQA